MKAEEKNETAPGRGEAGDPPSATPNEMEQARAHDEDNDGRNPRVGKHETGRGDSTGGELH